ncbi:MAG: phosphoribosylformylglycinamidine synthase subunit PurS [Thermoplasmata archaeon]
MAARSVPAPGPMRWEVRVELKPGVLDAEAESIAKSLALLGIPQVRRVSTARIYDLEFENVDPKEAERLAHDAVDRLLANPVIHHVTVRPRPD